MPDNLTLLERATRAINEWEETYTLIARAYEEQKVLMAEEKRRADESEKKAADYRDILVSRGGGEVHALLSELDAAREERDAEKKRADRAEKVRDDFEQRVIEQAKATQLEEGAKCAAIAREAALRRALESVMVGGNHLAAMLLSWLGASEERFPPFTASLEDARKAIDDTNLYDGWVCWRTIMLARAALAAPSPGLEQVRREAQIEALEKLKCEYTRMTNYTCLRPAMVPSLPNDPKCARCLALAALKGEKE